ncbi:sex peptide receptor-like [Patella vulgata]|uniref:sex peptide receptor-like n=1 Tax=Patella vulgata TaxID=6465 RepID=UPI0024A88814|nr:sex peptide receptor-like [Patella vulgata]
MENTTMENKTLIGELYHTGQVENFWVRAKNNSTFWILDGPLNAIICITVIILNILFLIVLQRKEMRSVTSFVLSAIAVADLSRALLSLPVSLYICVPYFKSYTPYHWCVYFGLPFIIVTRMLNTSSVWLTLYLGVLRYISVCHPIKAKIWCRYKIGIRVVIIVFAISFFGFVSEFFMTKIVLVAFWNDEEKEDYFTLCLIVMKQSYLYIQTILEIIFVQIIPCVGMLLITCKLVYTIKSAAKSREAMSQQLSSRKNESHQTTLLLIAILIAFLICEIPHTIFQVFLLLTIYGTSHSFHFLLRYINILDTILIQILYTTSAFNFCICCTMGTKFRLALRKILFFNKK